MKSIDGKIIPIDSLPADIREVFNHLVEGH
jgi:hypothetical protein